MEKANQSAVRWERDQSSQQLGALLLLLYLHFFLYISALFTFLHNHPLFSSYPRFHCCQPHESYDWGSCTLLSLSATSKFQIAPLKSFHQSIALVFYSLAPTLPSDCYAVSSHQGDAHTIHHNVQILSARIWSGPN